MLPRLVTGLTFVLVGLLLLLDAWDAISLPAEVVPAVLLIGLGVSLIAGRTAARPEASARSEAPARSEASASDPRSTRDP